MRRSSLDGLDEERLLRAIVERDDLGKRAGRLAIRGPANIAKSGALSSSQASSTVNIIKFVPYQVICTTNFPSIDAVSSSGMEK